MKTFSTLIAVLISFVSIGQISDKVQLKYNWDNDSLVGSAQYNNTYNEVWGFAQDGLEYAFIGSTAGTHVFNVTDPFNTEELAFIAGKHTVITDIVHRDYHDYKGYLYALSDEGFSSLQIMDLSFLPDSIPVVYDSSEKIKNAHNIFIDTATAKMYVCNVRTGEPRYAGFQVYSLEDPLNPTLIFEENEYDVHDIYARNDTVFLNSGNDGLIIYDFSNGSNPTLLGTLTSYSDQGYNHSSWLDPTGQYYYMADETHGTRIKIFDASDLSDLQEIALFGSGVDVNSIPHNMIWRNGYLFVSYYHDGLQIFDVSDPYNPTKVGFYDTYTANDHDSYKGAWGVYPSLPSGTILVSDMQTGLYVLAAPEILSFESPLALETNVFPNPFTEQLTISLPKENLQQLGLKICNTNGQIVFQQSVNVQGTKLRIQPNLAAGLYLLSIDGENFSFSQKLNRY
ncbi:MAG: choice-of-anchor B domain-containing protein [Flavobacteriales bacterium]|jgi:choice-of-anchor B domain-containing protein